MSLTVSAAYMDGGGGAAFARRRASAALRASRAAPPAAASSPAGGRWRQSMQELSRPVSLGARPASARATTCSSRDPASRAAALKRAQAAAARFGDESDLPLPGEWWRRLNKTQPMRGVALEEELRRQTRVALGVDGHAFGKGDADEGAGRDDALLLGGVGWRDAVAPPPFLRTATGCASPAAQQHRASAPRPPRAATAGARARRAPAPRRARARRARSGRAAAEQLTAMDAPDRPALHEEERRRRPADDDDATDGGGGGGAAPPPNSFLRLDLRSAAKPRGVHEAKGGAVVAKAPR